MNAVAFVHSHERTPGVWRAVADHLPPHWAVVAPDLFAAVCTHDAGARAGSDAAACRKAMLAQINRDLAMMGLTEPVLVVGEGTGAIAAIQYAAEHPGWVAGLFLSGPRLHVSRAEAVRLKVGVRIRRGQECAADAGDAGRYLDAIVGVDAAGVAPDLSVPRMAVAAAKDRGGMKAATALKNGAAQRNTVNAVGTVEGMAADAGWEYGVVPEASQDWYAYAPSAFAAWLTDFAGRL
ncbi:alpha/beta fold hydrolase [Trueperella pecoris]|uniref:alpha/beta fold hydrolase n=1 Tax=Trueperella pecoris TaxID=2733571 RepID=UPI001ABE46B6|nr:hypothetical protein [Trueperella pecoris]QTG75288.1 hypothetical protein J4179_08765 [Trueperella pecoris]